MLSKFFDVLWKYIKSAIADGFVEAVKGLLTGGSVGALLDSWRGFLIGIFTGTIVGAFIGSSLAKVFDLLLEQLHLLLNIRKIHYDLQLENIPAETASKLEAHFLLVRYGIDQVIQSTKLSKQDQLAVRLRNKEYEIETEYDDQTQRLTLKFSMKRHVTYGVQFKLYFTGIPFPELKPMLEPVPFIKEITSGGGDQTKVYVLIKPQTRVSDLHHNRDYSINEVKSIEGIPNNYIYPK